MPVEQPLRSGCSEARAGGRGQPALQWCRTLGHDRLPAGCWLLAGGRARLELIDCRVTEGYRTEWGHAVDRHGSPVTAIPLVWTIRNRVSVKPSSVTTCPGIRAVPARGAAPVHAMPTTPSTSPRVARVIWPLLAVTGISLSTHVADVGS
jgi:hypothetical protein